MIDYDIAPRGRPPVVGWCLAIAGMWTAVGLCGWLTYAIWVRL